MGRSRAQSLSSTGAAAAALAVLILLVPNAAHAAPPKTIAAGGSDAGQVETPVGVAVNESGEGGVAPGTLYVADYQNRRVDRFGPEGIFQLGWGFGVADGRSLEAQGCGPGASPPTKHCVVRGGEANPANNEIGAGAVEPGAVAVDQASGDVYVFDSGKYRIERFDPDGHFLGTFGAGVVSGGAEGSGDTEAGSETIKSASMTAKAFLPGQAIAGPGIPAGATVVDVGGHAIDISKPATATAAGVAISSPEGPENVSLDELQTISMGAGVLSGSFKLSFTSPQPGTSIQTTAPIPFNASAKEVEEALGKLSNVGEGNVEVSGPGGPGGTWTVEFKGARYADTDVPQLVAIDKEPNGPKGEPGKPTLIGGEATIATTRQGASAAEVCVTAADCALGVPAAGPGQISSSAGRALAFGPEGKLWVGDVNRLERFDPSGGFESQIAVPGAGTIRSLAIDSEGNPYLKAQSLPGVRKLEKVTGNPLEVLDEAGRPSAVAFDAEAGEVLVADGDVSTPYRFKAYAAKTGKQVSQFGAGQIVGAPGGAGLDPAGRGANALAAVGGSLYAASSEPKSQSAVQRFSLPEPGPLPEDPRAEALLPTSATLAATLSPEGHATTYSFQYGTSESYGKETETKTLPGTGFEGEAVKAELGGLIPETTYHFRLLAKNSEGEVKGEDATFTTRPAVAIEAQWASAVTSASVTLNASADPLGAAGSWWIEYGTGPAYGSETAKSALPASFGAIHLATALTGLQAATTYHYRFVATDVREGTPYTVFGKDRTFTAQLGALGFALPDERAWEMASPPAKHGSAILLGYKGEGQVQAAADGNAVAYLSAGSIEAAPQGNRAPERSSVLSQRGAGGSWSSEDISTPNAAVVSTLPGIGEEYKLFSADLGSALVEPRSGTPLSPAASERTPYLRANTDPPTFTPLVSGCPKPPAPCPAAVQASADVPVGTEFGGPPANPLSEAQVEGATADLGHVVLHSFVPLAEGVAGRGLYEWSAAASPPQRLRALSALPAPEGGAVVDAELGSHGASVRGAVAAGGSRVFWSTFNAGLYLRDTEREETLRLDSVQEGALGIGKAYPLFQAANAAGTVAFFTDTQALTADANVKGADLYRCEAVVEEGKLGCDLTDITAQTENPADPFEGAEVQGIAAGASEDGTKVYFVARGALSGENAEEESPRPGEPNLYLWRQGQGTRFIATLSGEDEYDWGGFSVQLPNGVAPGAEQTAEASPAGRYLAFMSALPLTGYDNRDARSGEADEEVFRYDAQAAGGEGELICASCNPSGARPAGLRGYETPGGAPFFDRQELWTGKPLAAVLPEATKLNLSGPSPYRPRAVHDDGRLFFDAVDPLVPADANGNWDVYEYEPQGTDTCTAAAGGAGTARTAGGCVSLLSSGGGEEEAAFLDASLGGADVFFFTPAQLSVTDHDQAIDVYDARTGGEPARVSPHAECLGEACQPAASPPQAPTSASAAFRGPGNLREAPARCAKGKVGRHGKCVGKHRKRKHRRAHRNGRAYR